MKTSRQRILEYIETHGMVAPTDLSSAFQITESNARYHLGILRDQGLVEIVSHRQEQRKGRPTQIYSLRSHDNNLAALASALLEILPGITSGAQSTLQKIAEKLAEGTGMPDTATPGITHLTQRLYKAIEKLNQQNYRARWEAHVHAPRIIFGQCPYTAILETHPELCQVDVYLLEDLLKVPVELIARLTPDMRGIPQCVFQIRKRQQIIHHVNA